MKKRKNMGKRKRNRIAMALIGVIALFLLSFLLYQRNKAQEQIARYNAQEVALKEKIEAENARTKEIDQLKEYMKTDEYAEEVAREKLGLVKDNEVVFQESSESGS
ncbi:MAG: septum formation initiator family protein [Lachnospiraceae bacterium]|nr:septum formation initiator family protein [Lachnospiraceae bacterium]MDD6618421.1 septum formation initiator family protein [Clostridiales bacterium]MDY4771024.1 septum formation initiator family protein [Lachnospiraceae bacterium]